MSTDIESCYPRGTGLVSVAVLPQEQPLSKDSVTEIELRRDFGFAVTIANHGCAPESKVGVALSVDGTPMFAAEGEIDEVGPGEEATVVLRTFPCRNSKSDCRCTSRSSLFLPR